MNWDAIGAIAELIGGIAVLATLVYLALQIRQNSESLRTNVEQSISDSLSDLYQQVAASDLAFIYYRASSDPTSLTDEEAIRFGFFATSYFRKLEQAHLQHANGNLSEESWNSIDTAFEIQFQSVGMRNYWEMRGAQYRKTFSEYVESRKEQEHPMVPTKTTVEAIRGGNQAQHEV